jgi:Tfp pilus assembly ATPase PilU
MDLSLNMRSFRSACCHQDRPGGWRRWKSCSIRRDFRHDLQGRNCQPQGSDEPSRESGMQTFDQSLFDLFEAGYISYEDALRNADSINDLRLKIKLYSESSKGRDPLDGIDHLNIV